MSGYVGSLTIAESVPICVTAEAQIGIAKEPTLTQLQARLAGVIRAQFQITVTPPTLLAQYEAALQLVAALEAAIALGLPTVDFQANALASLRLELEAAINILLSVSLGVDIQTPGVHLFKVSERNDAQAIVLRNMLNGGLPGAQPGDHVEGWYLAATAPAARAALSVVLG